MKYVFTLLFILITASTANAGESVTYQVNGEDFEFDTMTKGKGKGPNRSYSTADTAGCSCEQIIEAQGLGNGLSKYGCSIGVMDSWVELVTP